MKREKPTRELSLMYQSTNDRNLTNLLNLSHYFFLNFHSNQKLFPYLQQEKRHEYLSHKFNLNSQGRAFYPIEKNKDNDNAYKEYLQVLENKILEDSLLGYDLFIADRDHNLECYNNFTDNKVSIGSQEYKLFKYLKKNNLFSLSEIESITHKKSSQDNLYLCISNNPIDFIFASTNNLEGTCMSLTSNYSGCYFLGYPGYFVDKNRLVAFVTNGKVKRYEVGGYKFKHFRIFQRSYYILFDDDSIRKVQDYPCNMFDLDYLLNQIGYTTSGSNEAKSKFAINWLYHNDYSECTCMGYLDNFAPSGNYYHSGYNHSAHYGNFHSHLHFAQSDYIDEYMREGYQCNNCNDMFDEDNMIYANDDYYCHDCYHEYFIRCEDCEEHTDREDTYAINNGDYYVCYDCFEKHYFTCNHCEECQHTNNSYEGNDCELYCEYCYAEKFSECTECNEVINIEEDEYRHNSDEDIICVDCYDELFISCPECNHAIERSA